MSSLRALFAVVGLVGVLGCSSEEAAPSAPAEPAPEVVPEEAAPTATAEADQAKDALGGTAQSKGQTGQLVYGVITPKNAKYLPYVNGVVKTATMINSIALFNKVLTFPKNVPIVAKECGKVNAFYSPSTHDVSLCFEIIDALHVLYAETLAGKTEAEKLAITAKVLAFIALHEAGHAFLGENGIGVLGGEEDVVDDISGIFFIANGQVDVPLRGTSALLKLPTGGSFADEHSFSLQRYFNMLCLIYGSNPTKYAAVVGPESELKLPESRAARCPAEWTDKVKALQTLVAPYVRK